MRRLLRWLCDRYASSDVESRIRQVSASVDMAERWLEQRSTRVLISGHRAVVVSGDGPQLRAAADRMASETGHCVTLAVVVGVHHRTDCSRVGN